MRSTEQISEMIDIASPLSIMDVPFSMEADDAVYVFIIHVRDFDLFRSALQEFSAEGVYMNDDEDNGSDQASQKVLAAMESRSPVSGTVPNMIAVHNVYRHALRVLFQSQDIDPPLARDDRGALHLRRSGLGIGVVRDFMGNPGSLVQIDAPVPYVAGEGDDLRLVYPLIDLME